MRNYFYLYLNLAICTFMCNAQPSITQFNYTADMPALEKLLRQQWSSLFWMPAYDSQIIQIMFKEQRPGDVTARNQKLHINVLKEGDTLIGFISYYRANRETGHIELLAIANQYKGLGYGKKMVHHVQNWCLSQGCNYLDLYVYTTNESAINFYHHIGFAIKKRFPGYLLISKNLKMRNSVLDEGHSIQECPVNT